MVANKKKVAEILNLAKKDGRTDLLELESKQLLDAWGVRVNRTELARDPDEATKIAREIRYPLVMKVSSPDIPRKSEAKTFKIGVSSEMELRQTFDEIVKNARTYKPDAKILGVTIQEYLPPAREVIVGALQDPAFGPTVRFSLAGFWSEVLDDTSFRLAPLSADDAREMIREIKGYLILNGSRDRPPADVEALVDIIIKVGLLAHEFPEITRLDIDPVFAFEAGKGAIALNARMTIGGNK